MNARSPKKGRGRFQWNSGGWFGAQIGATLWVLIGGIVLWPESSAAGIAGVTAFVIPNAAGLALYMNRHRIAPYPAIQVLLFMIGAFSFGFIVYLDRTGLIQRFDPRLASDSWGFYALPGGFAALMLVFHRMEHLPTPRKDAE